MSQKAPDVSGLLPHRACRNCIRLKVKCIPRINDHVGDGQTICERCHRLGKNCTTPTPIVRKRRPESSSKVARLEQRINQLSSLLTPVTSPDSTLDASNADARLEYLQQQQPILQASSQEINGASAQSLQQPRLENNEDESFFACPNRSAAISPQKNGKATQEESLSSVISVPHLLTKDNALINPAEICPMYLDPSLEEKLFEDFRRNFSAALPFVIIPASTTARSTKKDRPFVFWSAVAVASVTRRELHYTLHEQLLKCVGEQMLIKAHKSLDLLQGILILINWYHYYSPINPQIANLLHLGQALTIDLGLNRPSVTRHSSRVTTDLADVYHGKQVNHGIRTSDDRRALLGIFWCVSRSALCFERIEPIAFTKHMEDCCRDLDLKMEHPSDAWIVHVIKLHQITSKYLITDVTNPQLPLRFVKNTFTREVDDFVSRLPEQLIGKKEILLEVEGCKLCLLGPSHLGNHGVDPDSAELLYASLIAIESFTEQHIACSTQEFVTLPVWYFFTYLMGALAELCFLNTNGWDLLFVRQKFGFADIMYRFQEKMEDCHDYGKEISSNYLAWRYRLYADKARRIIKWYETKVSLENRPTSADGGTVADAINLDTFNADMLNDFSDPLWDSIMGDWTIPYDNA